MNNMQNKRLVINDASQLKVLGANAVVTPPALPTDNPFGGWGSEVACTLFPHFPQFALEDLVRAYKVSVKSDSVPYVGTGSPDYSAVTGTTLDAVATASGVLRYAKQVTARRPIPQTTTVLVNSVPTVGSNLDVYFIYRERVDLNDAFADEQWSTKSFHADFKVTTAMNTTALVAQALANRINIVGKGLTANFNNPFIATVSGSTVTIVGKELGKFSVITYPPSSSVAFPLDATVTTTEVGFNGILDFKYMSAYIQTPDKATNFRYDTYKYLPQQGIYYIHYNFEVQKTKEPYGNQTEVNAVGQTYFGIDLFVNPALTSLVTQLNLIGDFS